MKRVKEFQSDSQIMVRALWEQLNFSILNQFNILFPNGPFQSFKNSQNIDLNLNFEFLWLLGKFPTIRQQNIFSNIPIKVHILDWGFSRLVYSREVERYYDPYWRYWQLKFHYRDQYYWPSLSYCLFRNSFYRHVIVIRLFIQRSDCYSIGNSIWS